MLLTRRPGSQIPWEDSRLTTTAASSTPLEPPSLASSPRERSLAVFTVQTVSVALLSCSHLLPPPFSLRSKLRPCLTSSGCVVFGRVAGDTAASYLLHSLSAATAANRLGQVGGHLGLATTVRIDPATKKVQLEFSWDDAGSTSWSSAPAPAAAAPAKKAEKKAEAKVEQKEYTLAEVAKHNTKEDCWVVVNGVVLDCTKFLPDRKFFLGLEVGFGR